MISISDKLIENKICNSRQAANSTQVFYNKILKDAYLIKGTSYFTHKKRLEKIGIIVTGKEKSFNF